MYGINSSLTSFTDKRRVCLLGSIFFRLIGAKLYFHTKQFTNYETALYAQNKKTGEAEAPLYIL